MAVVGSGVVGSVVVVVGSVVVVVVEVVVVVVGLIVVVVGIELVVVAVLVVVVSSPAVVCAVRRVVSVDVGANSIGFWIRRKPFRGGGDDGNGPYFPESLPCLFGPLGMLTSTESGDSSDLRGDSVANASTATNPADAATAMRDCRCRRVSIYKRSTRMTIGRRTCPGCVT